MAFLDSKIQKALNELKDNYSKNLITKLDQKTGNFKVYEFIKSNTIDKKENFLYRYIGFIKQDGFFIPAKDNDLININNQLNQFKRIDDLDKELEYYNFEEKNNEFGVSKYEEKILTALSMNSRLSYSKIGKLLKLKRTASVYQIFAVIIFKLV